MENLIDSLEEDFNSSTIYDIYDNILKDPNELTFSLQEKLIKYNGNSKLPKEGLKIAIMAYINNDIGYWDPLNIHQGLPGSEEAIVYASQELAKRHDVSIYCNPNPNSLWCLSFSNPRWYSVNEWNNSRKYDVLILWRRFDVQNFQGHAKLMFHWAHDSPPSANPLIKLPPFPEFNGVFILSEHHRRQYKPWPNFNTIPYTICGNGIVLSQFDDPMKFTNPFSVGYFSNYARGLHGLLSLWPFVKQRFPEATLAICYGRETWSTITDRELQQIISLINEYKKIGVIEHGKVGHLQLASIMKQTSVWAYPCNQHGLGETFCITAVKCQAAGMIPVTTRIGALNETIHPDAPSIAEIKSVDDLRNYKDLLINTLQRIKDTDNKIITKERRKYIRYARKYSWTACVNKWLNLIDKVTL